MTSPPDGPMTETIEQIIASVVGARVKGRYRKTLAGTVTRYEPLNYGGNDVLIKDDTGRECWYSSHEILRENGEPLPSRSELQQRADRETAAALRDIREQHIRDFARRWGVPGLPFLQDTEGGPSTEPSPMSRGARSEGPMTSPAETDTAETKQAGQPIKQPPMDLRILVVPLRIYLDGEYQGMEWRIHVQGPPKPGGDAPGFGHVRSDWHTTRAYSAAEREGAIRFWLDTFDTPSFQVKVKHAKACRVNRWTP